MTCPNVECNGSGKIFVSKATPSGDWVWSETQCPMCEGAGYIADKVWTPK